jgi:hypothetical protein
VGTQGIARDLAVALDPALLAHDVGLDLDAWQQDALRSREQQLILLCSRQSGKSTVSSLIALHEALYRAPALVLLLAPALRQAQELYRKLKDGLNALDRPVPIIEESALRMELANGSRIMCLPGKEATIRGFSGVALLIVDEASRVSDELYQAVRPMLAVSGGRILLLSTPWGKRGFFFEEWTSGEGWERVRVTAEQCRRIPRDWLQRERRSLPSRVFDSEYMCVFGETEDSVFGWGEVMTAVDGGVAPLFAPSQIVHPEGTRDDIAPLAVRPAKTGTGGWR